jgi:hypothetical protein
MAVQFDHSKGLFKSNGRQTPIFLDYENFLPVFGKGRVVILGNI